MVEQSAAATAPKTGTLSAADRLEIEQLITVEYFRYEDAGDFEPWADLFTVDGHFFRTGKETVVGRENLIAFAKDRWESRPELWKRTHWVTNVVIRPTPEGAEADCYQMTFEKLDPGLRIVLVSKKSDELRRENGRWRFYVRHAMPMEAE